MEENTMTKEQIQGLSTELLAQLRTKLDERDVALCERLEKQANERIEALRRQTDERLARFTVPGLSPESPEVKEFSFGRLLKGLMLRNPEKHAPHEVEMCRAAERNLDEGTITKEMLSTIDSLGGFIVPTQVMAAQIIPLLQPSVVGLQAGVLRLPGLAGAPVKIPKITGASTAYWLGEAVAPSENDVALGEIELYPHDVFALLRLSNRLIQLSTPGAEQIVREQLARDVALKIDAGIYNGTGANGQPTGIYQTTGIGAVTTFGDATVGAAYNKLLDVEGALLDANAGSVGEFVWAMHPGIFRKIRKMKDADNAGSPPVVNQQLDRRLIDAEAPTRLLGHRYVLSTQLPTDAFLLGAHAACVLGEWGTMVLAASNEGDNFTRRTTQILAGMTVDVGVRQPTAFCSATGVT